MDWIQEKLSELSDEKLIEMADKIISDLCRSGGKTWVLHVPVQWHDPDMILSEVVKRLKERQKEDKK